jgi:multidrug resistance protein
MINLSTNQIKLIPIIITFFIVIIEFAISFNSVLLPNLKYDLVISDQTAQITISLGLFTLGISGIIYGGLADSLGRKPMLIFSVTIFAISTFIITISNNITIFLIAKFFQGIGSGAGWVIGNACLKDVYSEKKYTQVMNYVHAIAGITPAIAPVIGSYLGLVIGWKGSFLLIFIAALIALAVIIFYQSETLPAYKPFSFKVFIQNYKTILSSRLFLKYLVIKVLCVMLIFMESSNIPLIFIDYMGVEPQGFGLYVFPVFLIYVLGTLISGKYSSPENIDTMIYIGLLSIFFSNICMLTVMQFTHLSPVIIQIIKAPCYFGWGFIFGNATAIIVAAVPGKASVASAAMIALEMLFSSFGLNFLGLFFDQTIFPLTCCLTGTSLFCIIFMYKFAAIKKIN